jgi:hypothetical protein
MGRLIRLLRPLFIITLLISVFALAFIAYTQHQTQILLKSGYDNVTELQSYLGSGYPNSTIQLPLTLSISWFANSTVNKTKFMDSLHQTIEPVKTETWGHGEAVTFWFSKCDVCDGIVLLHLPSYVEGNYTRMDLPFFDIKLCVP